MRRSRPLLTLTALASLLLALLVPGSAHAATPRGTEVARTLAAVAAWQPWTAYATGAHVTYNGTEYECIQGHTSQPGWEPPNVPALWKPATGTPGDTTKPSVPANLRSPAQGNTTIDLAWNASTDNSGSIKEYRVYEGTTLVKTSTTTSTQVTGLSPNTSHTYTVTAVDPSNNESDKSAPVTATTTNTGGDTTKPTVPGNLRSPAQSTITIDLAWDASTDNSGSIKEYRVYEGATLVKSSTTTSTQVTGLSPNTSHTYTVTAVDPSNNESAKSAPVTASTKPDTGGGTYNKVGYFVQWGIYGRGYLVKNLDTTGAAAKLTHVNYAFSNVNASSLTCMNGVDKATSPNPQDPNQGDGAGDAWADYGKGFSAGESVDGQADAWDAKLAGNFGQLKKLKAKYPNLKTLISIGGWTYSKYFSDLASTDARRKAFVKSCLDMYIKGDLPAYSGRGGPGAAAGVFDGIDVDWEWPGAEGHPGNHVSPNDKANLTLLLQEFRTQLDALGATTGKHYLLTAFTPADPVKIDAGWDLSKIFNSLDFANAQGYDFHGAGSDNSWEPNRTGHQGNLYLDTDSPYNPDFSVDKAVQKYLDAGVNPRKLTIGLAYYGRGWQQVTDGGKFGEWQDAHGAAPGQFQEEAGTRGYSNLLASVPNCTIRHDEQSIATYCFTGNGGQWWSFDDPWSIGKKTAYIKAKGLLGAMIWEMSGDPGVLTTALDSGLR
ncbi:glycosyl hydrolase family 18 protein [Nonomuraea sediminis]|uniref:glycosyl hydrolase family 18 protein n=1 Tax=Nonomuraea sediminis TaxID=2835864 RepID=UPI00202AA680|nr:glycosyl hydrolase family 18 protein [Nonomuraea sediminis]